MSPQGDKHRLRRFHNVAVPKIRPRLGEVLQAARGMDLPGGLVLSAQRISVRKFPTEAWNGDIDANRIAQILTAQISGHNHRPRRGADGENSEMAVEPRVKRVGNELSGFISR